MKISVKFTLKGECVLLTKCKLLTSDIICVSHLVLFNPAKLECNQEWLVRIRYLEFRV